MEDTKKKKKSEYDVEYAKTNIKRVPLDMQKSDYEYLKAVAASRGEKVNEYIKKAIRQRMERDGTGADGFGILRPSNLQEQE